MAESIASPALWVGLAIFVVALLVLDLGVFHRRAHEVSVREALGLTAFWIALALLFAVGLFLLFGSRPALEFLTGYLIEKALSVDNLFVFLVVFEVFAVPRELQHRVLFWGIAGALVMRAIFILFASTLIQHFHGVLYLFAALLLATALRLLFGSEKPVDVAKSRVLALARRFVPSVPEYRGARFTVVESGKRYATPLFFVLVVIETTDLLFALDSIPAIFAVTTDPFLVYTSNIFAILGLRALYFALATFVNQFRFLRTGVALVLAFVGVKMLVSAFRPIPVGISLLIIAMLLAGSVVASVLLPPPEPLEK